MRSFASHVLLALLVVSAGCGHEHKAPPAAAPLPKSDLPESYFVATAPAGALPVATVRKDAKNGDDVVVTGRIGGTDEPFVNGRASFTLADRSVEFCNEHGMDSCEKPWDACCTDPKELAAKMVTIEFRDAGGVLKTSARGYHGLDHMKSATVAGKVERDATGNLTIIAKSIAIQ